MNAQLLILILLTSSAALAQKINVANGKRYACDGTLSVSNGRAKCNGQPIEPIGEVSAGASAAMPAGKVGSSPKAGNKPDYLKIYNSCIELELTSLMTSFDCENGPPKLAAGYHEVDQKCRLSQNRWTIH